MISLHLTLSELKQLRQLLANQVDAEHELLLAKLDEARSQATLQRTCPLCQKTFTQLKAGRNAQYCSGACKQKAYRQRCDRARHQFGPRHHTS